MPRQDSSSCFSGFESTSVIVKAPRKEKPQQLACDRCRGQKLRCIRSPDPKAPCERCQKAGATCIIDSSVRMGRPRRTDKDNNGENSRNSSSTSASGSGSGSGSSRNPSQPTRSPPLPTSGSSTSQPANSVDFTPNSDGWSVHDLDETPMDPALSSVTVQYLESFDFGLPGENSLDNDMPAEHYLNTTLDLSSGQSIRALAGHDSTGIMDATEPLNHLTGNGAGNGAGAGAGAGAGRFPQIRQETMQELSDLNMQLSRQLGAVGSGCMGNNNNYTTVQSGLGLTPLATPLDENRTIRDIVATMMHGLQTYHRLLVEILGSGGRLPTHSSTYGRHDHPGSGTCNVATSMLSPAEVIDGEDSRGASNNHNNNQHHLSDGTGRPRRKRLRSDTSSTDFTGLQNNNSNNGSPPHHHNDNNLDMPTSLLLLSCHTNLVYLCRDAFAAIRSALLATHGHFSLLNISFMNIDDLWLPPDPDVQIIVLIQTVVRMIEKIGRLLGCPTSGGGGGDIGDHRHHHQQCEMDYGLAGGRFEADNSSRTSAIPQWLLDVVLKSEAAGEGRADRVGTQALREEIRGLHDLVYKPV